MNANALLQRVPMTAYSKGYRAEYVWVKYLSTDGWPDATRPPTGLHVDPGDAVGTPHISWEVRNRKVPRIHSWVSELAGIKATQRTTYGFVIIKPSGIGPPSRWLAATPLAELAYLGTVARRPITTMTDIEYSASMPTLAARLAKPNSLCIYRREAEAIGIIQAAQLIELLHLAGMGVPPRASATA